MIKNDKYCVKNDNPHIFRAGCGIVRVSTGDNSLPQKMKRRRNRAMTAIIVASIIATTAVVVTLIATR